MNDPNGEVGLRSRGRTRNRTVSDKSHTDQGDGIIVGPHEGSVPPEYLVTNSKQTSPDSASRPRKLSPVRRASSCSSPARDELTRRRKIRAIESAVNRSPPDVTTLKQLAISRGGLLNDEIRKKAWPALLNVDVTNIPPKPDVVVLHSHRDYQQVVLDVNRSIKRFPPGMDEDVRLSYQDQLVDCIMRVLVNQPDLHYYQGYHDIVVTFLLVVGEDYAFALMDKLSQNHLKDFMDVNMNKTNHILNYLYPIIGKASPKLRDFMEKCEVGTIFSLSWLITWYGHVLNEFRHIVRLYDFFIACHPIMPIYLAAATVLYREEEVLRCEPEMPFVHSLLSKMPDDLPFELLCSKAGDLFIQYPPEVMAEEARLHYEKMQLLNEEKLRIQQAARAAALARRQAVNTCSLRSRLWTRAMGHLRQGVLYQVTIWTLVAAFTAAAYTLYVGAGEGGGRSWLSWGS